MNTSDLELPKHLYRETTDPDAQSTLVTLAADKLIAWSEQGRGDAVDKWCNQICDRRIEAIDAWEDHRILQLEDEWISADNEVDENGDEDEEHYHLACEAVTREAAMKREGARKQMAEHRTAIEKLVQESRAFMEEQKPPPEEDHLVGYLIAIAAASAVGYVLLT